MCGDIMTDPSGEIDTSTIVANFTTGRVLCDWEVRVRSGRTIQFSFDKFSLPKLGVDACVNNFIMVRKNKFYMMCIQISFVIGPIEWVILKPSGECKYCEKVEL